MGGRRMVHSSDGILKMRKILPVSFYNLKINLDTPQKRKKSAHPCDEKRQESSWVLFFFHFYFFALLSSATLGLRCVFLLREFQVLGLTRKFIIPWEGVNGNGLREHFGTRLTWSISKSYHFLVVVQLLQPVWLPATPWTTAHQASLSFTVSQSLLKLMSIVFQPSCPLMYPSSPAFNLSQHQGLF